MHVLWLNSSDCIIINAAGSHLSWSPPNIIWPLQVSPQTLIWSLLVKLRPPKPPPVDQWGPSRGLWSLVVFLFSNSNYVHTALTVSPTTPKSSSSLLTRLDNPVLKAGILFAQRLFSTLIASDLMSDCELLVDCGHPHSVMAMAKQEQETMRAEL